MGQKRTTILLAALTLLGVVASALVLVGGVDSSRGASVSLPEAALPQGCSRPAGGYLIVMTKYGYNDSVLEGAGPTKAWPVIRVAQGQEVNITVCNADPTQAHGFQIETYYDERIVAVDPGQVVQVSFVANEVGTFRIYCAIFCTIHLFMQYGQLQVTP